MGRLAGYKPEIAMAGLQFSNAVLYLLTRDALLQGLSTRIYVVYRQAIATAIITPMAYFARRKSADASASNIGLKSFCWIFLASLVGVIMNQNLYYEGIHLASSSMGAAMNNLIPAITFIIAAFLGMEKINIQSMRTVAKVLGTILCVGGAISMTLIKGPKLFSASIFGSEWNTWLMGCLLLFASACCSSLWLILQVPVTTSYLDNLSLSAWMCFMATIQSAVFTLFVESPEAWILNSYLESGACLFGGVIGSGFTFFVQAWCISQRGPLFSAVFNPLCYVIVTVFAALFLHEAVYAGSLVGAIGVIIGLYVVLWGKVEDYKMDSKRENNPAESLKISIDNSVVEN